MQALDDGNALDFQLPELVKELALTAAETAERALAAAALRRLFLFRDMSPPAFELCVAHLQRATVQPGSLVSSPVRCRMPLAQEVSTCSASPCSRARSGPARRGRFP